MLQQASTVLAEDTRHTRKLLVHYGIRTQLLSLHEHNEHSRIGQVQSLPAQSILMNVLYVRQMVLAQLTKALHCLSQVLEQLEMGASLALVSDAGHHSHMCEKSATNIACGVRSDVWQTHT